MIPPLDVAALPPPARKVLDASAPPPMRAMAARGIVPGARPEHVVAIVAALTEHPDAAVSSVASATLAALPPPVLGPALAAELEPYAIERLARALPAGAETLEKLASQPRIADETLVWLAKTGGERLTEIIATNETRLLAAPDIIAALYLNKATRMSTADRLIDLAARNGVEVKGIGAFREAAAALEGELIAEATDEPSPDDLAFDDAEAVAAALALDVEREETFEATADGEEQPTKKVLPLHAALAQMPISAKIRRAILGTAAERSLLVRDKNKLVASAAIRSPQVQEPEVVRFSASKNTHDDVLRIIGNNGEWLKNHQVKFNLVSNPRTPFVVASKLVLHMREHELKALERSRDVSAPVRQAATQQLKRKGKNQ
ncbi:MAG: hypothetical protein IT374_20095 [Polyangiaceae bacterium]|nr:hypothetical protein [Polyangiaceae bacterium]